MITTERARLRLGGGKKTDRQRNYRPYVEDAVKEGLASSPWEELKEQVVLGSQSFVAGLREHLQGDAREQRAAARLARERPSLAEVIRCVEEVKGEKWEDFQNRHGDSGRDLVLYLGRRHCGLKLSELAAAMCLRHYAAAGMAVKRIGARLARRGKLQTECRNVERKLYVEM